MKIPLALIDTIGMFCLVASGRFMDETLLSLGLLVSGWVLLFTANMWRETK